MRELLNDAARRAITYLDNLPERAVAPTAEALANLQQLRQPLADDGRDPADILQQLDALATPATYGFGGPRFFGFVIGGCLPAPSGCELAGR